MYVLNILFYTNKRQEYARTHSVSNTHKLAALRQRATYRVATHRGGVRYIGSRKIVSVGIIRQQAAKRMSKYRLQNTYRIHDVRPLLMMHDAQWYFIVIKIRSKRWRDTICKTCIALLTARRLLLSDSAHTDCFRPSACRRSCGWCVVVDDVVRMIFYCY